MIVTHRVIILTIKIPNWNNSEYVIISITSPFTEEAEASSVKGEELTAYRYGSAHVRILYTALLFVKMSSSQSPLVLSPQKAKPFVGAP